MLRKRPAPPPSYQEPGLRLWQGEAGTILQRLPRHSVDCIACSSPYYGQRDYGVAAQIGLEADPLTYLADLAAVFRAAVRLLRPSGSLWINLADTYWSGRGAPSRPDPKSGRRRFARPQDGRGSHPWCWPKQLLLLPHRLLILLSAQGWQHVATYPWQKLHPLPDPPRDRLPHQHEWVFHLVRGAYYWQPGADWPLDPIWELAPARRAVRGLTGPARAPEGLLGPPTLATCPPGGTVLDPFCGTGTTLVRARATGRQAWGIDLDPAALEVAQQRLTGPQQGRFG